MDRLEAMSLFVAAVEAGSLSAAGRRFGIPLATVSRKVSDLEKHLQTRLLNRSTRQLTLTDAGQAYLAACRRILGEVSEAERTAAGEYSTPTGDLFITAPVVFGRLHVLPVVTEFLAAYPQVNIRLTLADRITQLVEEHLDLAIRIGELAPSSLVAIRVGSIRRVVCASPAYIAAHGMPQTPDDLAAHECISFEGPGRSRQLELCRRQGRTDRADPLAAARQHGGSGDRCRDCRRRDDAGALLPDRGRSTFRRARPGLAGPSSRSHGR